MSFSVAFIVSPMYVKSKSDATRPSELVPPIVTSEAVKVFAVPSYVNFVFCVMVIPLLVMSFAAIVTAGVSYTKPSKSPLVSFAPVIFSVSFPPN